MLFQLFLIIMHNNYDNYIPPYESEIIQFQSEGPVLVKGDMNGKRTDRESDYMNSNGNTYISHTQINQMGIHTLMTHRLIKANNFKPLESNDGIVNRNSKQLLQLCNS